MRKFSESQKKYSLSEINDRGIDIDNLLLELDGCSIDYEIISEGKGTLYNWVIDNYPFFWWGKIDTKNIINSQTVSFYKHGFGYVYYGYDDTFETFMNDNAIKSEFVYILWSHTNQPIIKMRFSDILEFIYDIFNDYVDTWIICPEEGWCIEHHYLGELSFLPIGKYVKY